MPQEGQATERAVERADEVVGRQQHLDDDAGGKIECGTRDVARVTGGAPLSCRLHSGLIAVGGAYVRAVALRRKDGSRARAAMNTKPAIHTRLASKPVGIVAPRSTVSGLVKKRERAHLQTPEIIRSCYNLDEWIDTNCSIMHAHHECWWH